jgi:hypothetical protein
MSSLRHADPAQPMSGKWLWTPAMSRYERLQNRPSDNHERMLLNASHNKIKETVTAIQTKMLFCFVFTWESSRRRPEVALLIEGSISIEPYLPRLMKAASSVLGHLRFVLAHKLCSLCSDRLSSILKLAFDKINDFILIADLIVKLIKDIDRMPDRDVAAFRGWTPLYQEMRFFHPKNLACYIAGQRGF